MKIHDEGIIVGLKKYGERGMILNIFSQNNGLIRGYSRASSKKQYSLILDLVSFEWKSKTDDGLGYIKFEILDSFFKSDESYKSILELDNLHLPTVRKTSIEITKIHFWIIRNACNSES